MSARTKQEYFEILKQRYRKAASKSERTAIVNEVMENTSLHRKSILRALNHERGAGDPLPKLGRRREYREDCVEALKKLYRASDYQCSDKLKKMIPTLLVQSGWSVAESLQVELLKISAASIDRHLRQFRSIERRRRNAGTRPGSKIFKRLIPIKSLGLISPRCGYLEADTVAHCGGNMGGEFIWSLTITDTFSGWTENRAVFGKSSKNVLPAIQSILESLVSCPGSFDSKYVRI